MCGLQKKRYAQWVIFREGKSTDEIDIKGLDVVRSSFPVDFKEIMKETLWYILKEKSKLDTTKLIMDFKDKIQDSNILNVMKNTGVKEISKYTKGRKPFKGYIKGTPIHVKSSINYNDMLHHLGIAKKFQSINDGDKIKWAYLKTNAMGFDTIALRGYEDPRQLTEFVDRYIDRNKNI